MSKTILSADTDNLTQVFDFINQSLGTLNIPVKKRYQLELAVEEVYVNIAKYAYGESRGDVLIEVHLETDPLIITVKFIDCGIPYNPLKKEDPDISLKTSAKEVGGLGIYLLKKNVDYLGYDYVDGQNILTLKKRLDGD